jgi:hypothetical protein
MKLVLLIETNACCMKRKNMSVQFRPAGANFRKIGKLKASFRGGRRFSLIA